MQHAIQVLKKHKATLEINIHGVPAMNVSKNLIQDWKKQVKDLKSAIDFLEKQEREKNRNQGLLKQENPHINEHQH